MSKRDDFPKKVINLLKERAGSQCSNPNCRVVTNGSTSSDGILNIGKAAHICAAAPLGPRYDFDMTESERKSYSNGIWLCSNCATEIDRDENLYTIDKLNEWKRLAEELSNSLVGKKALTRQDATDMLTMALSGFPKKFLANTISNAHIATSKSLEALDPRFSVNSSFENNKAYFQLNPKQPVTIQFTVKNNKKYKRAYHGLRVKGESLRIDMSDISTSGSLLIDEIIKEKDGVLIISRQTKDVVVKIRLNNQETLLVESLDDIHGQLHYGDKSVTFKGLCYNDLLNVTAVIPRTFERFNFKVTVNFDKWNGLEVNKLPYYNKILSLYQKLASDWVLNFSMEIEGEEVIYGDCNKIKEIACVKNILSLLDYTKCARVISSSENIDIVFDQSVAFSKQEHRMIKDASLCLYEPIKFEAKKLTKAPLLTLELSDEFSHEKINFIKCAKTKLSCFAFESEEREKLTIFNKEVVLYRVRQEYINFFYEIDKELDELNAGNEVKIKLIADENSLCIEKYLK